MNLPFSTLNLQIQDFCNTYNDMLVLISSHEEFLLQLVFAILFSISSRALRQWHVTTVPFENCKQPTRPCQEIQTTRRQRAWASWEVVGKSAKTPSCMITKYQVHNIQTCRPTIHQGREWRRQTKGNHSVVRKFKRMNKKKRPRWPKSRTNGARRLNYGH